MSQGIRGFVLGLFLAMGLCLSAPSSASASAAKAMAPAQKLEDLHEEAKLASPATHPPAPQAIQYTPTDTQTIQDLKTRISVLEGRISANQNSTNSLNNSITIALAIMGLMLAIVAIILATGSWFTYIKARSDARKTADESARKWMDENKNELTKSAKSLESDARNIIDRLVKELQIKTQEAIKNAQDRFTSENPSKAPEDEKRSLSEAARALREKPESQYTAQDWNTRAFAAIEEKRFELAIVYFENVTLSKDAKPLDIALALRNEGFLLGALGRHIDAISVYNDLLDRFKNNDIPEMKEIVALALFNKGRGMIELGKHIDAISAYDELLARFKHDKDPAIMQHVTMAHHNKKIATKELQRKHETENNS